MGCQPQRGTGLSAILAGVAREGAPYICASSEIADDAEVAARLCGSLGAEHIRLPAWASSGSTWIPELADPLVPTTMAALAGHPFALHSMQPSPADGWVSGHLAETFAWGWVSPYRMRLAREGRAPMMAHLVRQTRALEPSALRLALRRKRRELADLPDQHLRAICDLSDVDDPMGMMQQVLLEQRVRRHILRDFLALRQLGPSMLWFADPAWSDFWSTVPRIWPVDKTLYSGGLRERVFTGPLDTLRRVPANGRRLRSVRLPHARIRVDNLERRARKRFRPPHAASDGAILSATELDAADWLVRPGLLSGGATAGTRRVGAEHLASDRAPGRAASDIRRTPASVGSHDGNHPR